MNYRIAISLLTVLVGCDTGGDVEVLALPALERPTPEALMGLPEVAGQWRFAGWEVDRADSTALDASFPRFGDLVLDTQRLDSIAGSFGLAGGTVPVVGEVRKEGTVALVTFADEVPGSFLTGRLARDTLWLEMTSIMDRQDWPRDARAAFVREPVARPIAWLRGANPTEIPPSVARAAGPARPPSGGRSATTPGLSPLETSSASGRSPARPPRPMAPTPRQEPATTPPVQPRAPESVRQDRQVGVPDADDRGQPSADAEPRVDVEPESGTEPEPTVEPAPPPKQGPPPLLGEPVVRDNR